jgi:hypothetical protein
MLNRLVLRAAWVALLVHSLGCATDTQPDPMVSTSAAGTAAPSTPAATWTEVFNMMFPMPTNARCIACHANPANDVGNGNLNMGMDKKSAFDALVSKNSNSSRCMQRPLVVPGDAAASLLLTKLSPNPPCGSRMPVGGAAFSVEQLEQVRSWIAAGAKYD